MTNLPTRLAEISARLEAATPGPWPAFFDELTTITPYERALCKALGPLVSEPSQAARDAELIAHAPSDLAFLTAALRVAMSGLMFYEQLSNWDGDDDGEFTKIADRDCYRNTNQNDDLYGGLTALKALSAINDLAGGE